MLSVGGSGLELLDPPELEDPEPDEDPDPPVFGFDDEVLPPEEFGFEEVLGFEDEALPSTGWVAF